MKIRYLNGHRLRRGLIAGARRVMHHASALNAINVFPVADGDTGTNMAGTLRSVTDRLMAVSAPSLAEVSRTTAEAALLGSRGNSGAILAQFFCGLAEEFEQQVTVTAESFGTAARNAVNRVYAALSHPKEGTILTVLRQWADSIQNVCRHTTDFAELLEASLEEAKQALRATRDYLPELKAAGVVDAGAQGFVHLLEGIVGFMMQGRIRDVEAAPEEDPVIEESLEISADQEPNYTYCTECLVEGKDLPLESLRSRLEPLGDSRITAGSSSKVRIHIHTDKPEEVFSRISGIGVPTAQKVENMRKQYLAAHGVHGDIALVIDSACDLPREVAEKPFIHLVPLRVNLGETSYIDRLGITPRILYDILRKRPELVPSTSQPAPADFDKTFSFLAPHFKHVLCLSLSSGMSGTWNAARTAAAKFPDLVRVVDTKNLTVGAGLIAARLAELIEGGTPFEDIVAQGEALAAKLRIFVKVRELDAMIRSGRVSKGKARIANLLGMRPVITINKEGKAEPAGLVRGERGGRIKIMNLLEKYRAALPAADFAVAHVDCREDAEWFRLEIEKRCSPARPVWIVDAAPVLASHTGFGTVAVACLERR